MNKLLTLIPIFAYQLAFGQDRETTDSVDVRILNKGRHYIKEYVLTIAGKEYTFTDIWKNKYSEYQRLPYLWPSNRSKTTVIIKQVFRYDKWITSGKWPIDHIGEKKLTNGAYTIEIQTQRSKSNLNVGEILTRDNELK